MRYQAKTVAVVFCIEAVSPTELTLRQSDNRCTNPNPKAKFQCFVGCCSRCYIPHWRRLLYMMYHVRPTKDNTQPVCRRVKLNITQMKCSSNFAALFCVDTEPIRVLETHGASTARRISNAAIDDTDAMMAASKRHDRQLLQDINTRLVSDDV